MKTTGRATAHTAGGIGKMWAGGLKGPCWPDPSGGAPAADKAVRHVVFIDPRVPDRDCLTGGLRPGVQAFLLEAGQDGPAQIAECLARAEFRDLASISVLGHGAPGSIVLGASVLDLMTLSAHAASLARIGAALGPDGALQLYSCEVGRGDSGAAFLAALSRLVGEVEILAATHLVGSADLGAGWDLDLAAAPVHVPFEAAALQAYRGALAQTVWDQSASSSSFGASISTLIVAEDFSVGQNTALMSATVWLVENYGSADDGKILDFSGTLSWGVFEKTAENGVGALLASGSGVGLTQTDAGNTEYNTDIMKVDFSFGEEIMLQGGKTYWFAVHEGVWGSFGDGSEVYWLFTSASKLDYAQSTSNLTSPTEGWNSVSGGLFAFALQGAPKNDRLDDLSFSVTFGEDAANAAAQLLDGDVAFSGSFVIGAYDGGNLTVSGLLAEDKVSVRNEGTGVGQIGVDGASVTYENGAIGTLSGGDGGADLTVTFNDAATAEAIDALIENLTYQNSSDTPTATRTLSIQVTDTDGNAAISAPRFSTTADSEQSSSAPSSTNMTVRGDVDGDGDLDVVAGGFAQTLPPSGVLEYYDNQEGNPQRDDGAISGFRDTLPKEVMLRPFLGYLDGDSVMDLIVSTGNGTIHIASWDGDSFEAWTDNPFATFDIGSGNIAKVAIGDLNNDALQDAVIGLPDGTLRTFYQDSNGAFDEQTGSDNPFDGIDVGDGATPVLLDKNSDGQMDVEVTDIHGTTFLFVNRSNSITVNLTAENDAPVVANAIADQHVDEDTAWSFTVPANAFSDADSATLTYSATLADDSALPSWLAFDAGTRSFSGTPPQDFTGTVNLKVTASDGAASSSDSFVLTVNGVNDAPTGALSGNLADGTFLQPYTIHESALLAGFSDADGDVLSVRNLTANMGTLTNNGGGTWTWQPPQLFLGTVELAYEVFDGTVSVAAARDFDVVTSGGGSGGSGGEGTGGEGTGGEGGEGSGGEETVSIIEGTENPEPLEGTDDDDIFRPLAGDDDIFGGEGQDSVILPGDADGYVFVRLANGRTGVVDIDPSDGNQGDKVLDGIEFIRFGDEDAPDMALDGLGDMDQPDWTLESFEVGLVAATWQLLMGNMPSDGGFEYLILSDVNQTDLSDAYYTFFNEENRYLNFTNNLATGNPAGSAWFSREFGELSYEEAVEKAFDLIVTNAASLEAGGDPEASKQFFLDAQGYFEQVASERIVPGGVALEDATKIALISSVLYEAVRADVGPYAEAVNDFAQQVARVGYSDDFLKSILDAA